MKTETTIAKNIRIADDKAKYDAACKRLLSEKIILAWIMKNCLEEYQDYNVEEIAEKYIEDTPHIERRFSDSNDQDFGKGGVADVQFE